MVGDGWLRRGRLLLALLAVSFSGSWASSIRAQQPASPDALTYFRSMQEDAELTDVMFVDAQRGWAVGDRGVIWHTSDGGKRWQMQSSGVACRLESIHFIDSENGWAAGGETHPYTHTT